MRPAPAAAFVRASVLTVMAWLVCAAPAAADRAFDVRYQLNANGSIAMTGNTLLSCDPANDKPSPALSCKQIRATGGAITSGNSALNNNENVMRYVNVDDARAKLMASRATLTLPAGSNVDFAGLYWSGVDESNGKDCQGRLPSGAPARSRAGLLAPGDTTLRTVNARQVDAANAPFEGIYSSFADVTTIVRAAGAGVYEVADIRALEGKFCHAGWSLVVVYENAASPLRNLTVLDGLGTVLATNTSPITYTLEGFRTPLSGNVKTLLGFVGYEGDVGTVGDAAKLNGTALTNSVNPATNFFNSTISDLDGGPLGAPRNPQYENQLGYDTDFFDAGASLGHGATSATIAFSTNGDGYHPAVFALATDLYVPDVKLEKSARIIKEFAAPPGYDAKAEHGDQIEYTVVVTNQGSDAATRVLLADGIPAGTSYVPGSLEIAAGANAGAKTDAAGDDQGEFAGPAAAVRFRLGTGADAAVGGTLNPGASATIRFRVRVNADVINNSDIANQANVGFRQATLDGVVSAFSNIVHTPVIVPDLTILKTGAPNPPVPGAPVTYTLTVSNILDAPTKGTVTVTDDLPADFLLAPAITAGGAGWTCGIATRLVTCTRGDRLDRGASFPPITITATLSPAAVTVVNTGIVSGGSELNETNNTSTVSNSPVPLADVSVTKAVTADRVLVGQQTAFALAIGNTGPSTAANVTLTDTVPAGLRILSVAPGPDRDCTVTGQAITCSVGTPNGGGGRDLAPGDVVTIAVTVLAEAAAGGQTLSNAATVDTTTTDVNPDNDRDAASVEVVPVSNLQTSKTISPDEPVAGGDITYTTSVTNNGPNTATNVTIVDADVPAAVTLSGYRITEGAAACTIAGDRMTCIAPAIAVGQRVVVALDGTIARDAGGADLSNGTRALPEQRVLDPSGSVAGATATAAPRADLSIRKSMPSVGVLGRVATITFVVHNAGPSRAQNVMVVDRLPRGLNPVTRGTTRENATPIAATGATCAVRARIVACSLGTVKAGRTRTIHIKVKVTRSASFLNHAAVGSATKDPNLANNRSSARMTTVSARKTANRRTARGLQRVAFKITVRNRGTRKISGLRVCDRLPSRLALVSAPGAKGVKRPCWTTSLAPGRSRSFSLVTRAVNVSQPVHVTNRVLLNGHPAAEHGVRLLSPLPNVTG